jgi:hypothetical protein
MSPHNSLPSNAAVKSTTTDQIKGEVETLAWVIAASTLDLRSFEKQLLSRHQVPGVSKDFRRELLGPAEGA